MTTVISGPKTVIATSYGTALTGHTRLLSAVYAAPRFRRRLRIRALRHLWSLPPTRQSQGRFIPILVGPRARIAAVLDHDVGLRTERRVSHIYLMDVPTYHRQRLVAGLL